MEDWGKKNGGRRKEGRGEEKRRSEVEENITEGKQVTIWRICTKKKKK